MRRSAIGFILTSAALAFMAGCSGGSGDASITTDIKANLFSDPQTKSANVDVDVKGGVATLTGTIADDATRYEAFKVASQTKGVTKVNDQMSIAQADASAATAAPAAAAASSAPASQPSPKKQKQTSSNSDLIYRPLGGGDVTPPPSEPAPESQPPPQPAPSASDATAADTAAIPPPPPPPPQPRLVDVPAGTSLRVQMIDGVDSSVNKPGQIFHSSLVAPIVVNNEVIVPAGADVFILLTDQSSAGHITGKSSLTVQLDHLDFQGKSYTLSSSSVQQEGTSRGKRSAETIGGGAALGALLGAALGHGKGAAIGAAAGAAGGTAVEAATSGAQVRIPSETKLDFTLQMPVTFKLPAQ